MAKPKETFSPSKRIESFKHAIHGLRSLFLQEPNARIHLLASIVVLLASWYFDIDRMEWIAVLMCIGMVISAEIFNTSIENICDHISPEYHQRIKIIKDLAAAAVLVTALIALIVAAFIFGPRIFSGY